MATFELGQVATWSIRANAAFQSNSEDDCQGALGERRIPIFE
jgi:hypothetical protein